MKASCGMSTLPAKTARPARGTGGRAKAYEPATISGAGSSGDSQR